jgi:organic hydroperoxide reductase OsmC/OhrA
MNQLGRVLVHRQNSHRSQRQEPQQLFAGGWPACFLSAMKLVAGKMKVD